MRSASFALLVACSPNNATPSAAPKSQEPIAATPVSLPSPPTAAETELLAMQIEQGKLVFADKCADCHGAAGQGTDDGPLVIGTGFFPADPRAGSKRKVKFQTAGDVYAFAIKNMPADDPGTLKPDDYLAVIAYELDANGIKLERPLDPTRAEAIELHPLAAR